MIELDMDTLRNREVEELVDDYVCRLDRRQGDAWLQLFAPNGYYATLREVELEQANNVLIIGEDLKRLKGRIASGLERDLRRTVHGVSGVRANAATGADATHATASFTVWFDGKPTYAGVYLLDLVRIEGQLRIRRCQAVLQVDVVHTPIFLPI
jgi:3-phenylpropionate/cinnamic acid dioxygenase small subunit